jgi:hypothetical protein
VLSVASSVVLTLDMWYGNAKEDDNSIVSHCVNANWELQKRVIGLIRLIEVKHIVERIVVVVKEYRLIYKIFSVTLDNAFSNLKGMHTLTPLFASYLGPDPSPEP